MAVPGTTRIRLAELVAALSLATDLGTGQPLEHALRTCLLATVAGEQIGLRGSALGDVYYLALLRFVGCTADAHEEAALVGGDEIAFRAGVAPVLMGDMREFLGFVVRDVATGAPPLTRARIIGRVLADGSEGAKRSIATHCEVARMLATRIGLPPTVCACIDHAFERWDGQGFPGAVAGEDIAVAARIVVAARDVEVHHRLGGWNRAATVLQRRRGMAYDPAVVDAFLASGENWLAEMGDGPAMEAVLAAEPAPRATVRNDRLDDVLHAIADFVDLKAPARRGHSPAVATLAATAARHAGLNDQETVELRQAALVHDLGLVGIPNGILDKPGPLSSADWERVRLHPYWSERILSQVGPLSSLAPLAGAHHERMDGSGYHRGSPAALLSPAARILIAANTYQALIQDRPYRPALPPEAAAQRLSAEADGGRLDGEAVRCVLVAAGHREPGHRRTWPAGLSEREVEVLRLIARGASYKEVAGRLSISPRTAEHHVGHIYSKIGVSSRAAAALFAMEHRLLT